MIRFGKSLIVALLIFVGANSAMAGIVNNSTSSFTAADSITLSFSLLDSIGSVTALDSAADWFKIFVFNPAGDSVFGESLDVKQANAQIEIYRVATQDAMWTYKREVEDFDGSNVTQNGVWRWYAMARDSSLKLTTSWTGEFQLYTTGDFNIKLDSITQIPTGEITTGSFTAGAIDAAAIAADAIGASEIAASAIGTSEWAAEADNNGINWGDVSNPTTVLGLSGTTVGTVTTLTNNTPTSGTITTVTNSPFSAANAGSVADSVWRKGGAKVRLSDGDTTAIAMLYHIRDSMDEASATSALSAGSMGSIADSVWRKASIGGPAYADGTFGAVVKNDSIAIDAIRDSMDEASQVADVSGLSTFDPTTDGVNVTQIDGDASAASNLDLAFDNVIDSSVRLDLGQLRIAMKNNTVGTVQRLEPAFAVWHHGAGLAANFSSDSSTGLRIDGGNGSADHGLHIRSGTGTASSNGLMIQARSTGGSDAIYLSVASGQTNSSKIIDMIGNNDGNSSVTGIQIDGVGDGQGIYTTEGVTISGQTYIDDINLNASLGASDFAADYKDMLSDSTRKALGDTLTGFMELVRDTFAGQGWASTAASACNGSGIVSCTLDVRNTVGGLGGVSITISNTSNAELYSDVSDANGFVYFNLDQSTTYRVRAGGLPGSIHDSLPYQTLTTIAANNKRDTIPMSTETFPSATANGYKLVWGREYINNSDSTSGPASGVRISATLMYRSDPGSVIPQDTLNDNNLGKQVVVYTRTNEDGYWQLEVPINSNILPNHSWWQFTAQSRWSVGYRFTTTTTARLSSLTGF